MEPATTPEAYLRIVEAALLAAPAPLPVSELRKLGDGSFVMFDALFDVKLGASGLVVSFLAVLELVKEKLVEVTQNEAFAPIYVKLADGTSNDA